ncbi:serine protease [Streptomyces sp. NBC_01020]|uniref:VMAP-C domain-containing protein n=1 Tax=Streptomyces sp. NBC_01020 TaxID=2903722 RepID=UPI00386BE321|nr:serine protease [Streptomyces sp. NBC_01020]
MNEPDPVVNSLTAAATVHLLPAGGAAADFWGSGFFIAPGWVLTCAHVLRPHLPAGPGGHLAVRGDGFNDGIPVPAEVVAWQLAEKEGAAIPPERDLALVRLLDPEAEHECVWFTDRDVRPMHTVVVHGYRPEPQAAPGGGPVSFTARAGINVLSGDHGLLIEPGAEYPKGVSGGPLLDPLTGEVVGIIKSRRKDKEGGLAVAAGALRGFGDRYREVMAAHDRWHAARKGHHTWTARQPVAASAGPGGGGDWTPRDRRDALALLAELPGPATGAPVAALARKAARDLLPPTRAVLRGWRDGHGLLYDGEQPLGPLVQLSYLRLAAQYVGARGGATGPLSDWIDRRLEQVTDPLLHELVTGIGLPSALLPDPVRPERIVLPYPGPKEGPVVTVVMDPLHDDPALFEWTIHLFSGEGGSEQIGAYEGPAPRTQGGDAVWHNHQTLRRRLHEVLHAEDPDGDRPVPVEIALPLGRFDTPVHRWQLQDAPPMDGLTHLGAQRRLVVRDLGRRGQWHDEAGRDTRWQAAAGAQRLTVARIPEPGTAQRPAYYESLPPGAVPVLCRPAGRGAGAAAMELTLRAGHGIALWHIGRGAGHSCGEDCAELRARVQKLFDAAGGTAELPDRLRHLREDIDRRRPETHWPEPLMLLYDDPGRPLPTDDEHTLDSP